MVVINKLHLLYKDVVCGLPQPGIRRYFIRGVPLALPSWDGPGMDIVSLVSVSWGSHEPCHPGMGIVSQVDTLSPCHPGMVPGWT